MLFSCSKAVCMQCIYFSVTIMATIGVSALSLLAMPLASSCINMTLLVTLQSPYKNIMAS
jgi:hypothetical protein